MLLRMDNDKPEITKRIDSYLVALRTRRPAADGYILRHQVRLIYSMCRACVHGRMNPDQIQRLKTILRIYRRVVLEYRRSGQYVPSLVMAQIYDARQA
jgi:hypothetical protein